MRHSDAAAPTTPSRLCPFRAAVSSWMRGMRQANAARSARTSIRIKTPDIYITCKRLRLITFEYIEYVLMSGVKGVPEGSVWWVRWERLLGDLSGLADDHEKLEREELAGQVRDEQWADTSWTQLLVAATG